MKTPSENFADALGRRAIAEAVGVLPTAVSNAVGRGLFPSSWFVACQMLAAQKNLDCPPALFGMKAVNPQDVNADADNKGVSA